MKILSHIEKTLRRPRAWFLWVGVIVATGGSWLTAPETGLVTLTGAWQSIVLGFLAIAQGLWAVGIIHWARKALMDYPSAGMDKLFKKAGEEATGAGLALIAIAIIVLSLTLVFSGRAHAADLPAGFSQYGPALKAEQTRYWPDHPNSVLLPALVEQESGCYRGSKSCWNPGARLKSAREEGAGMGQITRAYRADGSTRFDALANLKHQYSSELGALSWDNVYQRHDLQLRALVLMSRDAARQFRTMPAMLEFGDAAYNGGPGDVQRERRACGLTPGCDAGQWFGHVELHCQKSRQPLYGNRSACDINREHVKSVMTVRAAKYEKAWAAL